MNTTETRTYIGHKGGPSGYDVYASLVLGTRYEGTEQDVSGAIEGGRHRPNIHAAHGYLAG